MMLVRIAVFSLLALAPSVASAQAGNLPPQPSTLPSEATSRSTSSAEPTKLPADSTSDGQLSAEQIQQLIRQVADNDVANDKKQRDYTYVEREEQRKVDGKGRVKSTEVRTREVLMLYGEQVERLISKNDKPLTQEEASKEEQHIQKIIDKRKAESDEERKKRLAKEEKEREDGRRFVQEVANAYNFHLVGVEKLEGRDTYVIDATPRAGYQPGLKEAKILPKFRFRIWIDTTERQWVKLDAESIDTVSFGLLLVRLHKGSRVLIDTTRVNEEVWLPKHVAIKADARIALLKNFRVDEDFTYRDYKKFRSDTKIVGLEEALPPQ